MRNYLIAAMVTACMLLSMHFLSCKKEYSDERGVIPTDTTDRASGTLKDTLGNCQDIIVQGTFIPDSSLIESNSITVTANITSMGKYQLYTDTINGCWFMDSGIVNVTGVKSFTLKGYGKPSSLLFDEFSVHFGNSVCHFSIPTQAAEYRFDAPTGSCPDFSVKGSYYVGAKLGPADSVTVPVIVSIPGTYLIQTDTVNGMSFSATGTFLKSGRYSVALKGAGMPLMKGEQKLSIAINNKSCPFFINVQIDTSMNWHFTAEGVTYSGITDSAYGVVGDTGHFFGTNPNRVFATELSGTDTKANINSSYFYLVLSRLNTPLTTGSYLTYESLGEADFNVYFQFSININSEWFYASSYKQKHFTLAITSCDPVTKLLTGTFSGPVYKLKNVNDQSGPVINIINGSFKTYLAH